MVPNIESHSGSLSIPVAASYSCRSINDQSDKNSVQKIEVDTNLKCHLLHWGLFFCHNFVTSKIVLFYSSVM